MALKFFNTYKRKLETFKPIENNLVKLYTCGPTIYSYAHIGNFRAYIFEDLLRRYLKYRGYGVMQVMNLTDVDDKTIRDAKKEGLSLREFTKRYEKAFFEDLEALGIEKAEFYPKATDHINEMVEIIQELLKKGLAYKSEDGSVYFNIKKFKKYGKLAGLDLKDFKPKARIKHDEYEKEGIADFALWKSWDENDGNVFWATPLGKGRPGWHLECSAMSIKYLGKHFDIHTGGVDNIFPHHENEIAQSEAFTGEKYVKYWLYCEHLLVNNQKMSKSLGNFFTLRDLLSKGYPARAVRYVLLATHYRQKLNFTLETLEAAKSALQRFEDFMLKLKHSKAQKKNKIAPLLKEVVGRFEKAMDADLNISEALAAIFDFMREVNKLELAEEEAKEVEHQMLKFDTVLGLVKLPDEDVDEEVMILIQQREHARLRKDWKTADEIRDILLNEKGIQLNDTPKGVVWKKVT